MMNKFFTSFNLKSSSLYFLNRNRFVNHYHDIVPLQNVQNIAMFKLKNYTFVLRPETTLNTFRQDIHKKYPDIEKINIYEPFSLYEYSEKTPLKNISDKDFIFKLNNANCYKIIADFELKEYKSFDLHNNYFKSETTESVYMMTGLGGKKSNSIILSRFINNIINEITDSSTSKIDPLFFKVTLKKVLGEIALKEKKYEKDLELQMDCLQKKLARIMQNKEIISKKLEKKGIRRVNMFLSMLLGQIALIQYGTYVAFSWDIMEPITCLLGVIDLIIAYSFWLYSHKEYSFEELKTHYIFRRISFNMNRFDDMFTQNKNYEAELKDIEKLIKIVSIQMNTFKADWKELHNFFRE